MTRTPTFFAALLAACCLATAPTRCPAAEKPLAVGPAGADFISIQAAINAAQPGQTVEVRSGTYRENVQVNKPLVLRGVDTGSGKPLVDAGRQGSAIVVSAERVTVEGFRATNSGMKWGDAGILVTSKQNTIRANSVAKNHSGIFLQQADENTVTGPGNTLKTNQVAENQSGIVVLSSPGNTFVQNSVGNHAQYGIRLDQMTPMHPPSYMCTLCQNNLANNGTNAWDASGKPFQFPQMPNMSGPMPQLDPEAMKALSVPSQWDNGTAGNYYSDYDEPGEGCADGNGIADQPHPIPGGAAVDRFPLVKPFQPGPERSGS